MSKFDQREQKIETQYNVARDIVVSEEKKLRGVGGASVRTVLTIAYIAVFSFVAMFSYTLVHALYFEWVLNIITEARRVTEINAILSAITSIVSIAAITRVFLASIATLLGLVAVCFLNLIVDTIFWIVNVKA